MIESYSIHGGHSLDVEEGLDGVSEPLMAGDVRTKWFQA